MLLVWVVHLRRRLHQYMLFIEHRSRSMGQCFTIFFCTVAVKS
jgi:hypothetical protein